MKTAEELLKEKRITPETAHHNYAYLYRAVCDLIGEAQKEAYNQALEDAETEEMKANAKLIAAAPELLDALIETDKDLCVLEGNMAQIEKSDPRADGMTTLVSEWRKRNKKAINKALGL